MQVNKKAGLDFATVMKAFLRADPDIIMVGEMRDPETTGIGIEASLTGHLVFATLHTNSAPESIIRLLDMGMDPFNFCRRCSAFSPSGLPKRLCKECKVAYQPSPDENQEIAARIFRGTSSYRLVVQRPEGGDGGCLKGMDAALQGRQVHAYRAKGCPACNDTGYKGASACMNCWWVPIR